MSNALRTALDYVSQDQTQRAVDLEAVDAADMWAPRRAYEAGRIGADINANNADIASLRNAGHMEEAAALAKQNAALQRRQALYAPDVARVEDIGNNKGYLRDGLSWFGSQVGGAAASTQDPIALSAAAQAVGAPLARMGGTAGLIGKGIQYAGPLGAYGLNQRQMTGEHYGRLLEDPAAMQRLGHQGAYQQSNLVGAVGGVAETLLPGMVGRALGGAALAKGGAGMLGRSTGAKALGGTLMEGGTELTQGEISRLGLGYANPNRDTSRDASDRWNEALGGMAGGAPISAAGAYADTAYGRANRVGEVVREKAGEVADLMSDGVGGAKDKVGEAYKDSGIKGVVDLGVEAGKSIWGNTKGSLKAVQDYLRDEHGKIDLVGATQRARADVERYRMSTEEADLLSDLPPPGLDEAGLRAWSDNNVAARTEYVTNKLADLEAQGVEEASPWLDAIQSGDPIAMGRAVDEASAFLLERNTAAQVRLKAAQSRGIIGEMIQKGAERATRAAKAVSGAAVFTGMNAAEGVRKGLDGGGRKLNAQGAGLSTLDYDAWRAWRDKKYPAPAVGRGSTHAIQRAAEGRRALQELRGEVRRPIDPAAVERSRERATLFGEMLAAEAKARSRKIFAARADEIDGVTDYTNYVRSLGYEISDIADMWAQRMIGPKQTQRPVGRDAELAHGSMEIMDSMAEDLHGVLGDAAPDIVGRMAQSAEPAARPFFEYLQERVDDQVNIYAARAEHRAARAERRAARAAMQDRLQDQMLALLPQEHQTALREDGGAGARNLVQTVRMISRGRVTLGKRREVERAIGVDTLDRMLEIYGGMPEEPYADLTPGPVVDDRADLTPGPVVDDRGQGVTTYSDALSLNDDGEPVFEGDSYDARMAEKSTRSNRAPKIYMFDAPGTTALHSTDAENIKRPHDPFESSERPTGDRAKAIEDDARRLGFVRGGSRDGEPLPSRVRPRLIEAANPDEAREKMKAKVDYLRQTLARDKAAHHVDVVSAKEVMDSLNYSREKRLAMYRDYMFQDARRMANSKENPDPEGAADAVWQAVTAHAMVVEGLRAKEAKTNTGHSIARRKVVVAHRRAVAELKNARKDLDAWVRAGGDPERLEAVVAEATARAEELASTLAATSVLAKGREEVRSAPPPNSDQALVAEAMERYFASRYMVQAERASGDRVTGSISAGELVDMAKSGAKARSNAGKSGRLEGMPNFVEGGLLNFAQPEDGQLLGRAADKTLTIPVERLVGWVRSTRQWEDDEYSKRNDRNADERFVDDLLEGIAAVVDSGLVEGMPWINGRDGKKQVFSDDSISWANKQGEEKQVSVSGAKLPNDLHLPTKTGRGANYNTEKRREHAVAEAARKNQRVAERLGMDPENPDDLKRAEGLRWERRVEVGRDKAWAEAQKDEPFTADPTVSNLAEDGPENIHSAVVGAGKPRGEFSAPEGMTEAGKAKRQERLHAVAAATRNRRASEKVAIRPESSIVGRYAGKDEQGNAKASRASEFVHTGPRDSGTGFTRYVTHETPLTNQQKNRDRNDVTPLDTSLFIEAEETEFTDQQLRGKGIDTPKFENRMSAQAKARERAEQVFVYDEDPLEHDDDGKPTHVPREPNFEKTLNNVRQRLRIAQEKGQEAGARGGIQYVWPLTHALSVESLSKLADSPEYDRFLMAHSAVAHLVATSDKLAGRERVAMARAMAEGDGSTSTHFTGPDAAQRAKVWLDKAAGIYRAEMTKRREAKAAKTASKAAPEVAASGAPKSQEKRSGAAEGRDLGAIPMYYKMPAQAVRQELRAQYPDGTTTAQLMADGHRTATTRRAFGDVGDTFTVGGTKYRITALEKVNLDTAAGRAKWSQREGWDVDYVQRNLSGQVYTGATQTVFERVGEAQTKPGGVKLSGKTPFTPKDQVKADQATKFIGRGSERSSTALYAKDFGALANTGSYTAADTVFVSAEGVRAGRLDPDFKEIDKAIAARATIVTDNAENRAREYNVGERQVAAHLTKKGYTETSPGTWTAPKRKLSLMGTERRAGYPVTLRSEDGVGSIVGKLGPFKNAAVFGVRDEDGANLYVADITVSNEPALTYELFRNADGQWEVGVDGPQPGTKPFDSFRGMFDVIEHRESDGGLTTYSKFKPGSFSTSESRTLLRTLRDYAAELGVQAADIVVERDTGIQAGKPQKTIGAKNIRKFNAQGTLQGGVVADMMGSREIMRTLGFKAAPEKFANVAEKLLAHPDQHPDLFIRQSAEGLSHILMEGEGGKEIRDMLKGVWWEPLRRKVAARLITQGMPHGEALTHAYREITRMALARELEARTKAKKTFTGRVMQLAKDFVSRFHEMTKTEQFEDLVRNRLNDVIKKSMGPIDLKEGYTRVTFQQAVDGDPQAAAVLAHMTKNKNIAITGSIVLAANGSMYRDAANMLHDLDFIVQGSKEAAEAHLRSAFPDAVQVYDFQIPGGAKTDSFAVPPPGAKVINVQREFGDKGRLRGYDIARDGRVVGEMRVVGQGESAREVKTGERGTLVDLFTGRVETPSHTIKFEYGGKSHLVRAMGADHIFDAKLAMSRDKDLGDYRKFVPNVGRKFNQQGTGKYEGWKTGPTARQGSGIASDADIDAARDYVNRVLGKQIKTEFENITGYSGEFIEAENAIRISTLTNAGVLNVARHEALHAFFAKFIKNNPKAVKVLSSLTDDERVLRRLQALLKDEPAALEQLADGEERLAFIYQFAMAGQLKLPHTPGTTLMHKIRKFLRRVFQMVSDQERAVDLLYAFEHGKMSEPSAAARAVAAALNQGTWLRQGSRKIDGFTQMLAAVTLPASTILLNSASPTARKIGQTLYSNPGEEGSAKGGVGYINERNQQMRRYDNLFRKAIDTLDARQMNELIEAMQRETPTNEVRDPDVQQAKEQLHALFARFYRYLKDEKGLRLGYRGENYFPVVWDVDGLMGNPKAFKSMLLGKYSRNMQSMAAEWEKARQKMLAEASPETLAFMKERGISQEPITAETVADTLYDTLTRSNGVADAALTTPMREDGVLRPWMAASELRELDFIAPEDRAPFLEKDLVKTLSRYVRQGVHTAEYSARFGRGGKLLDDQLKDVRMELERASAEMLRMGDLKDEKAREKWVKRQYRDVANAVGGIEGSLGSNVSETVRKINSWAIVYQNVRLLPLALFSSFVDPLGIVARGGEMRDAWATFMDGMKGVARQWGDMLREEPAQRRKDQWEALAEHAGVIDGATFSHLLHDEYASVYLNGTTKKINETMFKANGMEAWNRAMRVGATRSAVRFMERHDQKPTQHSERWMRDLGFEPGTLPLDADGHLITDKRVMMSENPNMGEVEAEAQIAKVHYAINRWVEGAILSPNAAQRPAWGSDPHYSMFWHLKQFAYSFHETIMKRALSEAKHGNVMPLGVFAWYIPTMIAADVTKGLMLGGGELPAYMKSYDLGDWMLHGVDRAGVLGMGQVAIDVVQDPGGAAGPVIEQVIDSLTQPIEETIIEALPAHAFYKRALA